MGRGNCLVLGAGVFAFGAWFGAVLVPMVMKRKIRAPKRVAGAIRLKAKMFDRYTQLHDHTWDEVMQKMYEKNMRNFSVYLLEEESIMFSYFEYVGNDFEKDMKEIGEDPVVIRWWSFCEPCQDPFHWSGKPPSKGGKGEQPGDSWWAPLKCLNHCGAWPVLFSSKFPDPAFFPQNPQGKKSTSAKPL